MTEKKSKAPLIIALIAAGVILIAGLAVILYFFLPSRRLENALGSGRDNCANGYYDRAERAYENALELDPKNLEAYKGLFDVCMGREDFDDIEDLYDDAKDALSNKDFVEFDKYVIKKLETAIKKAEKHEEWELGIDILEVYVDICDNPDLKIISDFNPLGHPAFDTSEPAQPDVQTGSSREELGSRYGYGYEVGEMISDFTFSDEDGNLYSISDFQGKAVYINFFTTWCTYCFYELPDMMDVSDEFAGDAVVIMIDLGEGPELGMQYAEDYDVDLPIYYVDGWELDGGLSIEAVPLSIVIDRYGMVHGNHLGMAEYDWMHDTMEEAVNTKY